MNHRPFSLIVNDITKESMMWNSHEKNWDKLGPDQYDGMRQLYQLLRGSDKPSELLKQFEKGN